MNVNPDDLESSAPSDVRRRQSSGDPTPAPDKESSLRQERESLIKERRQRAGIKDHPDVSWGVALSGGGIRSATFCLGLLRSLAKNGILRDFDYLSTVSGGGYIGASLGRLYRSDRTAEEVEKGVARDDSTWLWWLRANGRYLTPAGAKDLGLASASILRGVMATHGELAMLILFLASWILLPHLLVTMYPPGYASLVWNAGMLTLLGSVWWWLMVLPLFAVVHQIFAYWYCRESSTLASYVGIAAFALVSAYVSWRLFDLAGLKYRRAVSPETADYVFITLGLVGSFLLLAPLTAWVASLIDGMLPPSIAQRRFNHTQRLALCLWALLVMALLGLLDYVSWYLSRFIETAHSGAVYSSALSITAAFAVGRILLPQIQKLFSNTRGAHFNLERAVNIFGLLMSLGLALVWTTAFHVFMLPLALVDPNSGEPAPTHDQLTFWMSAMVVVLIYLFWTRKSFELLNMASLHNFYRSRIERAYVSSGNSGTESSRFPRSPLDPTNRDITNRIAPLVEVIAGDDVELNQYRPHDHGGPIHLINCCINQSVDDRTGNYNADRKGIALTVSALGVETGVQGAEPAEKDCQLGKLSKWIAVSGAAASTGMGSMTSPGLASLLFMSGLRLGYWTRSLLDGSPPSRPGPKPSESSRNGYFGSFPKPLAIVSESIARFPGLRSPIWYLSDGGHFDNTAIYALLKREVSVIVAADCGADPKYLFADIESLVRKADIDYGAKIEFLSADALEKSFSPELLQHVGTPESIGPEPSPKCLVVGRIRYASGAVGTLLVVKPCRLDSMPFDIVAYADRNVDFPQQTTSDQFFDEAQWESYHLLGLLIGSKISRETIAWAQQGVASAGSSASSLSAAELASSKAPSSNRRQRMGETVRASVGAGISLSLILAVWQGIEQYQTQQYNARKDFQQAVALLDDRIKAKDVASITTEQMLGLKKTGEKLGQPDLYADLLKRLGAACSDIKLASDQDKKDSCLDLIAALTVEKRYDFYWLADRARSPSERPHQGGWPPASVAAASAATMTGDNSTNVVIASSDASADAADAEDAYAAAADASSDATAAANVSADAVAASSANSTAGNATATTSSAAAGSSTIANSAPSTPEAAKTDAIGSDACNVPGQAKVRVFLQIYDEDSRPAAALVASDLAKRLHMAVPPIENVVATAEKQGVQPPYVWSDPVFIYHKNVSMKCVDELRKVIPGSWNGRPLPSSIPGSSGVVEYWLPPRFSLPAK